MPKSTAALVRSAAFVTTVTVLAAALLCADGSGVDLLRTGVRHCQLTAEKSLLLRKWEPNFYLRLMNQEQGPNVV